MSIESSSMTRNVASPLTMRQSNVPVTFAVLFEIPPVEVRPELLVILTVKVSPAVIGCGGIVPLVPAGRRKATGSGTPGTVNRKLNPLSPKVFEPPTLISKSNSKNPFLSAVNV